MSKTILTIDTKIQRQYSITIDKSEYELRDPRELTPFQRLKYPQIAKRLQELEAAESQSETEAAEADTLLAQVCAMIVDAPGPVLAKLTASQRLMIVGVYATLQRERVATKAAHPATTRSRKRR